MAKKEAVKPVVQPSWVKPAEPVVTPDPAVPAVANADTEDAEQDEAAPVVEDAAEVAEVKVDTVTVVATSGFNCRLSHDNMVRVEAGISEMDPAIAKELANHWFAQEHGFKIYSKE